MPALRSFPADGVDPAPRRMVGSMLFLAWMAACGPHALLSRLLPRRIAGITILGAAVASTVLSLFYIRTNYIPRNWYGEYGVERIHMFRAIWEARPEGTVFLRPSTRLSLGIDPPEDELFVSFVPVVDPGELRRALAEDASRIRTVILPAHTEADRNENRLWIDAFSDIAPPSAWRTGPTDPSGKAMYLVVRLPREGLGSESVTPAPDGRGD